MHRRGWLKGNPLTSYNFILPQMLANSSFSIYHFRSHHPPVLTRPISWLIPPVSSSVWTRESNHHTMEDDSLKKDLRKDSLSKNSIKSGDGGNGEITLKPKMTLLNGVTVIVGSIIGSGIFVSPAGVLLNTGSVNMSLIVWVLSGLFSMVSSCLRGSVLFLARW